jgi:orotate phosphoribosyltransferase-like protein
MTQKFERTPIDLELKAISLYSLGLSYGEIASRMRVISKTTVERILRRHEVKPRHKAESMTLWWRRNPNAAKLRVRE